MLLIASHSSIALNTVILLFVFFLSGCSEKQEDKSKQAAIHLKSSNTYLEQGQFRAAIIEARNTIKYSPNTVDGYITLARIYNQLGSAQSATNILKSVSADFPKETRLPLAKSYILSRKFHSALETLNDPTTDQTIKRKDEFQLLQANALAGLKRYDDANRLYRQLLDENLYNNDAHVGIIKIKITTHQLADAKKHLLEILSKNKKKPEALLLLAEISYLENDLDSTETHLTNALQLLPQTDIMTPLRKQIYRHLSETLIRLGRPSEAMIYSKVLAEANPEAHEAQQRFIEALTLYQKGKLDQAEKILLTLYKLHPSSTMSGILLGQINYEQGDFSEAGELLQKNIDVETSTPQLIRSAALAQLKTNRPEQAIPLLTEALKIHPNDPTINTIYGLAALNEDMTDPRGVLAIQKAIAAKPEKTKLHLIVARHYLATDRPEQAYAQYKTALSKSPNDSDILQAYISALLSNKDFGQASTASKQLLINSPNNSQAYLIAAQINIAAKDLTTAKLNLEKAVALDSNNIKALLALGKLNLLNKNWDSAEGIFRKIISVEPSNANAYKGLISSYEAKKDSAEIIAELSSTALSSNGNSALLTVLAEYHVRDQNIAKAEDLIHQAIQLTPISNYTRKIAVVVYRSISSTAFNNNDLNTARKNIAKALTLKPGNAQLLGELTAIELKSKNYEEALSIANQIEAAHPNKYFGNYLKGKTYAAQKNWAKATKHLKLAWDIQPNNTIALLLYETLSTHNNSPKDDRQEKFIQEWQEKLPDDAQPITIQAITAQKMGASSQAIRLYEQALKLNPSNSLALNNLAWLYFENKNPKARELSKQAYQQNPNNAGILDTYGWILLHDGETKQGLKILELAIELEPDNIQIQSHIRIARSR